VIRLERSPETAAVLIGLRRARATVRSDILKNTRREVRPMWRSELVSRAHSTLEHRTIVAGSRVGVTQSQISLVAASTGRPLSGGLIPTENRKPGGWPAVEFGARTRRKTFDQTSPKGRRYTVTKRINVGLPHRNNDGRIAFDASSDVGRFIVASVVRTIVDQFRSFAEITPR